MSPQPAVAELYPKIERFVARRVRNPEDREDLVQEIFLKMKESLDQLRDEERLLPWLYRSAYHRVVDYYRARGKPPPPPEAEGDAEEEGNRNAEVAGWLRPFVDSLGPEDREILVAIEFEGRTQKEAAAALGLSLAAAKSRHRRAKQRLQAALRACCEFHLDRRRNITDIRAKGGSCACGDKPS